MSENQIIAASLQIDTGSSNANIKEVNKNLKDVKASLKDTGTAAASTGKEIAGAGGHFKNIKDQMSALPGPLGQAGQGVNSLSASFKALLANPVVLVITLIVGALALLYKSFVNTASGGQKMEQIFAGIKAAGQALFDNLGKIASSIIKVFSFDFSGAIKDMREVGEAAVGAFNAMSKLTKEAQQIHREQLQNDLEAADRQKKLAILREQTTDETVPIAKRKAALLELRTLAEKNAEDDINLAKKTADNIIAQKTLEKDGALKNQDEINAARVAAVNVETENANELRRIGKQISAIDKQEIAERKEANAKAAEAAKIERQKLEEFNSKLSKLQRDNELALIADGFEKEKKALQNKIEDEKHTNALAFQDRKITREQYNKLNEALDIQGNLQREALEEKHNKEVADKEAAFQKDLATITNRIKLAGITDARQLEKAQLQIGYEEKLAGAIAQYKNDQASFQAAKNLLDEEFKAQQNAIDEKNKKEDDKKNFVLEEEKLKAIIDKKNLDWEEKLAAVDAEQALIQKSFDDKILTEQDYNTKSAALSEARKTIRETERDHNRIVVSAIGDAFGTLSEIAGKQTLIGKALAIAQTTIKTYQSGLAAFEGMISTIPGPVGIALGVVAAAGALATGIAAVRKIVAVQVPGTGGGAAGTVPTGLPAQAAPVAPAGQTTAIDQSSLDKMGEAASRRSNSPVRAYVVGSDVTQDQDRNARLERASKLN